MAVPLKTLSLPADKIQRGTSLTGNPTLGTLGKENITLEMVCSFLEQYKALCAFGSRSFLKSRNTISSGVLPAAGFLFLCLFCCCCSCFKRITGRNATSQLFMALILQDLECGPRGLKWNELCPFLCSFTVSHRIQRHHLSLSDLYS